MPREIIKKYREVKNYLATKHPRIFFFLNKEKLIFKFLIALSVGGIVDLIALVIFYEIFKLNIIIATSFAFAIAFFVGFYLQKRWVFDCDDRKKENKQMVLFLIHGLIKMSANAYLMFLLVDFFKVYYLFSQVVVGSVLATFTYLFEKFIIFRKDDRL